MIKILPLIIALLLCGSCIYWVVAWIGLRAFFRPTRREGQPFAPTVSILKPVKGLDAGAWENFTSFCRQDYPEFELLFGVLDAKDPCVALVERLKAEFPKTPIRLLIASPVGHNPKSSILDLLAREARHEVLVISDSDIRVTPDYLQRVVAPLSAEGVGLVTCLYQSHPPRHLAGFFEALYLNCSFQPSAVVASRMRGVRYGFGATLALRREDLHRAGGYAAIADYLADDYQVASRMVDLGLQIQLSDYIVSNMMSPGSFAESWGRELRWARGIRVSAPLQYPGLLLTFTTPLALLLLLSSRLAPWAIAAAGVAVAIRWAVGWSVLRRLGWPQPRRDVLWLPVRDCFSAGAWCCGAVGRKITWRGERFMLRSDGRLSAIAGQDGGFLRRAVWRLDALLQRREHIFEYSHDPECILRASEERADTNVQLADGTQVCKGQTVLLLHLWNEHVPRIGTRGADMALGAAVKQRMVRSLQHLTAYLDGSEPPRLPDISVIHARMIHMPRNGSRQLVRMMGRLGFELFQPEEQPGLGRRVHDFFENFLIWGLLWAYNPGGLRGSKLIRDRHDFWISRQALRRQYGTQPIAAVPEPRSLI